MVKLLTTAMGEATSDYLAHRFSPVVAGLVGAVAFCVALSLQLSRRRYVVWNYWLTVAMVAVFGTMAADGLHVELGVPYAAASAFYLVALTVIFAAWRRSEGTLSIHSIDSDRRELFYWATVLATFALGTADGDLTATTARLGYLSSGLLFVGLFALPGLAYRFAGLGAVPAFWAAYILTRPLGASFADWFGVPTGSGGLGLGRGVVAVALAVPIVALVAWMAATHVDQAPPQGDAPA